MSFNAKKYPSFQLVIGSENVHKIREIKSILHPIFPEIDLLSLIDFPSYVPCEETGKTFEENATLKAENASKALNQWVIADDSGLVVPALQGSPGVYSARYAGKDATYADNRKKLLLEMENLKDKDRFASLECCIALASPEGLKKCVCASCEGKIAEKEIGKGGFGYDPLFIKHDYRKTLAELENDTKNKISHRRKALDKIMHTLKVLLS